ncbi:MAG: hypothetical protein HDT25_10365 [Ruminococcus sp.]|nr:hypothetical protein [Ruminococcus sp.]
MKDKKQIEKENEYFSKKVIEDEMQRTLSFELEHKSFRMWYILNMVIMLIVYFVFTFDRISVSASAVASEHVKSPSMTPAMQVIIMLFYGAMLFSLSLYNYRAASMGVLDAFASKYQKGITEKNEVVKGEQHPDTKMRLVSVTSVVLPATALGGSISDKCHIVFFLVWTVLAFAYEVFTIFCLRKNMNVIEKMTADEEAENNDDD